MNKASAIQASNTASAETRAMFARQTYRRPLDVIRHQQIEHWKQDAKNPNGIIWKTLVLYTSAAHMHNELALDYVLDALCEIKKTPLYRQDVKRQVRDVEAEMQKYNAKVWAALVKDGDDSRMVELDQEKEAFTQRLNNHLTRFYYAVKQSLDDHRAPHSAMLAQIETADDLLGMAVLSLECNRGDPLVRPFMHHIRSMNLSNLRRKLQALQRTLHARLKVDDKLLTSPRALDAWKVLCTETLDYEKSIVPLIENRTQHE